MLAKYLLASAAIFASAFASLCHGTKSVGFNQWQVHVDNDPKYNKNCGGGCLDNLRGRCGAITEWGCTRASTVGHYTFQTQSFCTNYDVTQALKACTNGEQTIDCTGDVP